MKKSILFFLICTLNLSCISWSLAQEPLKIKLEYSIPKSQKIKLKVTEIPRQYPWLERDDDGSVSMPEIDSIITCENPSDLKIFDEKGNFFIIPEGTRFYARLKEIKEPKSFWRKGEIKLDFYKIATGKFDLKSRDYESLTAYDGKHILQPNDSQVKKSVLLDPESLSFDSEKKSNFIKGAAENLGITGGYMIAGAILAPLAVYSISSSVAGAAGAGAAVTNPYVMGAAVALGGGIGLVYGIKKEGKKFNLEPGKELEISIADPWLLTQSFVSLDLKQNLESSLSKENKESEQFKNDKNFKLNITEVKQTKDEFGDKAIKIALDYENHTEEELRITSFVLLDSTGKEYEPSYLSDESSSKKSFGELPLKGKLDLYFSTDFPNAVHYLKVVKQYNQKPIFTTKISGELKKQK